jgi:hypothetical protein
MFGNLGSMIGLGLKLRRAQSAIEKEGRMYDVKVTLVKGAKSFAIGAAAVAVAAVAGYMADSTAVTEALKHGGMSDVLVIALVPVIKAGGTMLLNWLKNR